MEDLKQAKSRLGLSTLVLFLIFSYVGYSVLNTLNSENIINPNKVLEKRDLTLQKNRGQILDRDGYILATTIQNNNLILNPSIFKNPNKIVQQINKLFYEKNNYNIDQKIDPNQKYLVVKKILHHLSINKY